MELSKAAIEKKVREAFSRFSGSQADSFAALPHSASDRVYFRISHNGKTIVATYSPDADETQAFVYLSAHFVSRGLPVPEVIHYEDGSDVYFQSDLGDVSLYNILEQKPEEAFNWCSRALSHLVQFQVAGAEGLDFSRCFPRHSFDVVSVLWDLNYFKYSFLKPSGIDFHEGRLEDDFRKFSALLSGEIGNFFLYRDFQARNIMVKDDALFFIDFQGGRRGSLCYDPASFIYSARSPFTIKQRDSLLEMYKAELAKYHTNIQSFEDYFYPFLLLRILQTFGAYGYRGWFERKQAFNDIVPRAVRNLNELLPRFSFLPAFPELKRIVQSISVYQTENKDITLPASSPLVVSVYSFSYKHQMPADDSGNGGGFVFDCRALPNPGKFDEYKALSGKDEKVQDFLKKQSEVSDFLANVKSVISPSVEKYISRGFTHLMVSFGCTGGQHRSVYCAEQVASFLACKYPVKVSIEHLRQGEWGRGAAND